MLFQRLEKWLNKVAVAEEIGCENDLVLSKYGWWMARWVDRWQKYGWMGGEKKSKYVAVQLWITTTTSPFTVLRMLVWYFFSFRIWKFCVCSRKISLTSQWNRPHQSPISRHEVTLLFLIFGSRQSPDISAPTWDRVQIYQQCLFYFYLSWIKCSWQYC